jgi:hypothetical protein
MVDVAMAVSVVLVVMRWVGVVAVAVCRKQITRADAGI